MNWPTVALGDVLTYRKEFIRLEDDQRYVLCRVQWYGQGVIERGRAQGFEIKTKTQQVCKAGDFIVAEIDAKEGGFGIVPPELEGAIVSSHYFLFEIDRAQLEPAYLGYYVRLPAFREQVAARGSTNYSAVRPNHVLNYTIPLPPLAEQQRIVAKIERLAGKVEEARRLREGATLLTNSIVEQELRKLRVEYLCGNFAIRSIGQIAQVSSGGTPPRDVAAYWNGDIPWIKTGELVDGDIDRAEEQITETALANSSARLFPPDTVLIALYGQGQTRGRTGRLRIAAATNQACCAVLPTSELLDARYTQYWLRSFYSELREDSHGGAQPNWNAGMIKRIPIALPSLEQQHVIVMHMDRLQSKLSRLKATQLQTSAELDALLPAILDRAFKGDL